MADEPRREILIPEVLPPEAPGSRSSSRFHREEPPPRPPPSPLDRVADVLGPVFAGVLVDAIAMTAGTFGLFGGAFLGFWFARVCGFRLGRCFTVALLAGYYGYLAIPRFMPIATIVGIFFALKKLTDRHER